MNIEPLTQTLPDFAKDIRLNFNALLNQYDHTGLTNQQLYGISLAVAYSLKQTALIAFIKQTFHDSKDATIEHAATIASTLMAMNNVYYRFTHLITDKDFSNMPTQLRMNSMQSHGIAPIDFELMSLAVSAINGCGLCMDSHTKQLVTHGVNKTSIQSTIRLASVLKGAEQALTIEASNNAFTEPGNENQENEVNLQKLVNN